MTVDLATRRSIDAGVSVLERRSNPRVPLLTVDLATRRSIDAGVSVLERKKK